MRFVKLMKGREAHKRGLVDLEEWSKILDEPIEFLEKHWWIIDEEDIEEAKLREKGFKKEVCEPIAIIVNSRLYLEKAEAWIKDDTAYVEEDTFKDLI